MHRQRFGPRRGRLAPRQHLLQLAPACFRVGRSIDLAAEGDGDAALDRQRADLRRRPGEDVGVRPVMRGRGDAEGLPHDDRGPGHRAVRRGEHGRGAEADGAEALGLRADHEARLVDEGDDRQVEDLAFLDEAADLERAVRRHRAGVEAAVVADHADRLAREPREAGDLAAAVAARHLEEAAFVHDMRDQRPHVEDLAPVARHDRGERLVRALGIVAAV